MLTNSQENQQGLSRKSEGQNSSWFRDHLRKMSSEDQSEIPPPEWQFQGQNKAKIQNKG